MLRKRGDHRPTPVARKSIWVPSVASLYQAVPLRQENAIFAIGERCNANGSKKWRELQETADWDGCVAMGREQIGEGSHALDICTAFVGRDENAEMTEIIRRFTASVNSPLVIDSTETPVIEAALKLHGGKPIINSINFEDGEHHATDRLILAKRFGAAVIALTIDEVGMAKTPEDKLRIAERLVDFACNKHGLAQSDLLIDPLTFTIATGNEDDRKLAQWTLEGIAAIREKFPEIQIILGLSNVSFGLNPAARAVLNSVFLDHAKNAGMSGAIIHVSKIRPLHLIAAEERQVAEDLIFDRRREGYDPLQKLLELFAGRKAADAVKKERAVTAEGRLKDRIVDGDRKGLNDDLDEALLTLAPLDIINNVLLDGMKVVGDLFGAGKMQLPFVLQSRGNDEKRRRLSGTDDGAGRRPGKGHHHSRHGQGRRARHRQEPCRHHPDQQRLPRRQPGHQGSSGRHAAGRAGQPRPRHRHVRPAGQIHRRHARKPGRNVPPRPRNPRPARWRRADPQLCGG